MLKALFFKASSKQAYMMHDKTCVLQIMAWLQLLILYSSDLLRTKLWKSLPFPPLEPPKKHAQQVLVSRDARVLWQSSYFGFCAFGFCASPTELATFRMEAAAPSAVSTPSDAFAAPSTGPRSAGAPHQPLRNRGAQDCAGAAPEVKHTTRCSFGSFSQ